MSHFPEELLAATEDTCQREPVAARTRLALMRLEKEGHRAGWDSPTNDVTIFRFERDPVRDYVKAFPSRGLTDALRHVCDWTGGDVGEALARVADAVQGARGALRRYGVPDNVDVCGGEQAGHNFYGYAMRHEGWASPAVDVGPGAAPRDDVLEAIRTKTLHQLPDRIETRMVMLQTRDGLSWWCQRRRRLPPVETIVLRPESDYQAVAGLVLNALGRMTNAAAGNVSPVPDLAGNDPQEFAARMRRRRD